MLLRPDFQPDLPSAVAFSGGADSTALLWAAAQSWPNQVHAIHVHHGLQAAADDFARHCRTACDALRVPLHVVMVDARNAPGASPEDAARKARYTALAQAASAAGLKSVWLAQHADDQVETMLLALSRGAGLPGLAAMPARFERHGMRFERPLLATSGAATISVTPARIASSRRAGSRRSATIRTPVAGWCRLRTASAAGS